MMTTNPIADAVAPLRADAIERAAETARQLIAQVARDLDAAGGDRNVLAPYPSGSLQRDRYAAGLSKYRLVRALTTSTACVTRHGEPDHGVMNDELCERFIAAATASAADQYDAFVEKLQRKIGPVDAATLDGSHVWGWSILTVTKGGAVEQWKTQQIVNVSSLGTVFNQWPTRQLRRAGR